jgi:hypothetical protein
MRSYHWVATKKEVICKLDHFTINKEKVLQSNDLTDRILFKFANKMGCKLGTGNCVQGYPIGTTKH